MAKSYVKRAEGLAEIADPLGSTFSQKTATCAHCSAIVYVQPGTDGTSSLSLQDGQKREPPSVCHMCWALVCPKCHATGECRPLEKQIEKMEARQRFFRSAGLIE